MDTITTDSGKKLKLEEAWVVDLSKSMTFDTKCELTSVWLDQKENRRLWLKRVWVLVEVDSEQN